MTITKKQLQDIYEVSQSFINNQARKFKILNAPKRPAEYDRDHACLLMNLLCPEKILNPIWAKEKFYFEQELKNSKLSKNSKPIKLFGRVRGSYFKSQVGRTRYKPLKTKEWYDKQTKSIYTQ